MRYLLAAFFLTSCAAFSGGNFDPVALADEIELYRQDVLDLMPLAEADTQEKLIALDAGVIRLQNALRNAEPAQGLAQTVLALADSVIAELDPDGQSDIRVVIGMVKIALRHAAAEMREELPEEAPVQ